MKNEIVQYMVFRSMSVNRTGILPTKLNKDFDVVQRYAFNQAVTRLRIAIYTYVWKGFWKGVREGGEESVQVGGVGMATDAYEVRKRIFNHDNKNVKFRCRRCGHEHIVSMRKAEMGKFKCQAEHCGTEFETTHYNIVYRLLVCGGATHVCPHPAKYRFQQWSNYKIYHGI